MRKYEESPNLATDIFITLNRRNKVLKAALIFSVFVNVVLLFVILH